MKSKTTVTLFSFFLGGIGVHRFYLGQTGLGFLYLLFCWTFIPALVALVDFIIFLTMSEEAFNAKYNSNVVVPVNVSNVNTADELEKLFALKQKGVLTEEEFQKRKARLL